MATLHRDATPDRTGHVVLVKGAVERMLDLCSAQLDADGTVRPLDRDAVLRAADDLAGRGLRVLATAIATAEPDDGAPERPSRTGDTLPRQPRC